MVDFRRIAILEPSLVFPRPLPAMSEKEIISLSRQWGEVTLKHGADAWYFRFHSDYEFVPLIQAGLAFQKGIVHLVPFPSRHLARPGDAVHFRYGDSIGFGIEGVNRGIRGISCHTIEELRVAQGQAFDYAFYSPVFKTKTHPDASSLGYNALRQACSETSIPIFALGGIIQDNEKACLDAGAFGIAGIRMFL